VPLIQSRSHQRTSQSVSPRRAPQVTLSVLAALPGGQYSWATGIGQDGTVIGRSDLSFGWHAVYWPAS
jgi:hypothetical protein